MITIWSALLALQTSAPAIEVYKIVGTDSLTVHVVSPPNAAPRNVGVMLLHGGGWAVGSPRWVYDAAAEYAARGAVAIAVQYRLSGGTPFTPADAAEDVRDATRWIINNAARLRIDPGRIIAHGISAGGHLAAVLAESEDPTLRPKALVLWSPGVAAGMDPYFIRLMGGDTSRAKARSPDEHVRAGMPPTIIISGALDSIAVTPPVNPDSSMRRFCGRMRAAGNRCEIASYPNLGHMLARNLARASQARADFDADPAVIKDAESKIWAFLRSLGYFTR